MLAIDMKNVSKSFSVGRNAVENIDWTVPVGSIHGLIGSNGAGKTTLMRLALGVLWSDDGEVWVLGQRLDKENTADLRQRVHYVSAENPAPSGWRVGEWVRYLSLLYQRWDARRAKRLIEAMEIDPDQVVDRLSTGQQASLNLALAVSVRPDLLLLDEPMNGLDVVMRRQFQTLIMEMAAEEESTLVLATHAIEDIERMTDTTTLIYRGRVVLQGELDNVKGRLHRLQVVMPGEWPSRFNKDPHITATEHRGHVALVTVDVPIAPYIKAFREAGALLVEPVEMDLSEVVRSLLEREGYTRESIRWNVL